MRRALEIAQAARNINGVLEALKLLLKRSFKLAHELKYEKARLKPKELDDRKVIFDSIVKPMLQDNELKKFIFHDLGKSLREHGSDANMQDDQVGQLNSFVMQKV